LFKEGISVNKKLKKFLIDILIYILGSFIYAVAVTTLISANQISPGGFTGIATLLNYLFLFQAV